MANPQKENGYTQIANEILEKIISSGLNGTEIAIILYIFRKTYGYHKKEDEISISQFEKSIKHSKSAIIKALKNLQLINIIILIKKGNSLNNSNLWSFNKNHDKWLSSTQNDTRSSTQNDTRSSTQNDTYKRKEKKRKKLLSANADIDSKFFSLNQKIIQMFSSKDKRMSIIATYWIIKDFKFTNKYQYESAIKRELKASSSLKGYDLIHIKKVMLWLKDKAKYKWTLETVFKYINEDLTKLEEIKQKAYIEGDRAYQKNNKWFVICFDGVHREWNGSKDVVVYK